MPRLSNLRVVTTSEASWNGLRETSVISLLEQALDHLEEGVIVTDSGDPDRGPLICYANRAFSRMTGYKVAELVGQSPRLLQGPRTDTEITARLKEHYEAGDRTRGESVNYRKDGSDFIMHWQVFPVQDTGGRTTHYIGVHKDISRIRRLEEDLLQAQKMDAIGRLARGIAHDFNNLLAVILSFSELLLEEPGGGASLTTYAGEIHKAARRAAGLTSELMAFSRRDDTQPELLDLGTVLAQMARIIRRIVPENIEVVERETRDRIYVRINRTAFEQALVHLATNARDALPEGGQITIELSVLEAGDCEDVIPGITNPRSFAIITFADNGVGMTDEVALRVFEPFFTTKSIGKGTGLGLSTTYATVKNAGGHIKMESRPGKGSCVTVYLPRVTAGEEPGAKSTFAPELPIIANQAAILVVEDDESMRDCIAGVLSVYNYEVHSVASAEEALAAYESKAGHFRLLLTDLVLPKMNGTGLARRLLEKNPELRVLYMTGYEEESHGLIEVPGKVTLLRKPFSLNQVLTTVQEALRP